MTQLAPGDARAQPPGHRPTCANTVTMSCDSVMFDQCLTSDQAIRDKMPVLKLVGTVLAPWFDISK